MLSILFILPLLILPFFDRTVGELPFIYFLSVGILPLLLVGSASASNTKTVPKIIILLWGIFLLRVLVSAIFSIALPYSVLGLFFYVSAFTWFLAGLFLGDKDRINSVAVTLIVVAGLLSLVSVLTLTNVIPKPAGSLNLLVYTFGHHRIAGFLVLIIPLIMTSLYERKWSAFPIVSLIITLPLLILSGARAAVAGFLLSLWYLLRLNRLQDNGLVKIIGASGLIALLSLMTIPIISRAFPNSGFTKILSANPNVRSVLLKPLTTDARLNYWSQAARAIMANPEGRGVETARFVMLKFRRQGESVSGFVHNHYLQLAAEVGLSGAMAFLILVGSTLWFVHQRIKLSQSLLLKGLGVGLFASVFTSFFDFDWYFPGIFLLFWFIAGLVLGVSTADSAAVPAVAPLQLESKLDFRLLRIFLIITGLYGVTVLSGSAVVSNSVLSPILSRLHPILEKKSFEVAQSKLPIGEFGVFIDRNMGIYRFDNLMLAKILQWQQYFGTNEQTVGTAIQMLENDPLDKQAQQTLQEAAAAAPNP